MSVTLTINGEKVEAEEGATILEAADSADVYIPRLCHHPGLGSSHGMKPGEKIFRGGDGLAEDGSGPDDGFAGCRLCVVEVAGREGLLTACDTPVADGMEVNSESDSAKRARKESLAEILKEHPHACLQCAQQEGCSRTQCSSNVPEDERCCEQLGHCEVQKVAGYVGIRDDLSKYAFAGLPKHEDEPLFTRDYNLCISCLRCVRACRELRGVEALGFVYNDGKVLVGPTGGADFASSECRFCGACAEVCPTGAIMDKDMPKGDREAALVPCRANCPAGLDIPGYIDLIYKGDPAGASALIRERLPFPNILGRVCFHPCEDACRRSEVSEPMAICALKRYAAENEGDEWKGLLKVGGSTGKKVAVVGSGPAGLTAAWFLARKGHAVTVYEEEEKVGGMLRYGIPDYRIPPDVLDAELEQFSELGVVFKTGTRVGGDLTLDQLQADNDAVFLGTGAFLSRKISVEGDDMEGILWGLDMLKDVKRGKLTSMSGKGVVIGGGNVAIDVARTALRLGADSVELACLECSEEMPAHSWEIEEAEEEGVSMEPSWGPKKILGEGGKVTGIELKKCTSVFDSNQCFAPEFDDGETISKDADWIALAIGQAADLTYLADGKMAFIEDGMSAGIDGVFAGGEAARGPSSVVEAVADGAAAASAMDRHLGGDGEIYRQARDWPSPDHNIGRIEGFAAMGRVDAGKVPAADRVKDFCAVENAYDGDGANGEAARCLRCDLRVLLPAVTLPPDKWLELTAENVAEVPAGTEGVYQLLDEEKLVIAIKGTQDIQDELQAKVDGESKAAYFSFEPDPMYSKRESELIQQFLQQFGRMPEGDGEDDEDDLF